MRAAKGKHWLLLCAGVACCLLACPKAAPGPRVEARPEAAKGGAKGAKVEATPTPTPSSIHTVRKGETPYGIARSHGVPLSELLAANGLNERAVLHIGQRLRIPGAAAAAPEAKKSLEGLTLEWPVEGMLYAKFGKKGKEIHDGVDIAAPLGTPVKAAAAGKVLYAGEQKGYGRIVIVEHAGGLITLYAHNHELRTKTGATVAAGAPIATVGKSGRTSGPHLHFELRKNGIPVDPLPYFKTAP